MNLTAWWKYMENWIDQTLNSNSNACYFVQNLFEEICEDKMKPNEISYI